MESNTGGTEGPRHAGRASLALLSAVGTAGHESDIVGVVMDVVPELVGCERVLVFLHDDERARWRVYAPDSEIECVPVGSTVVDRIFRSGHGEIVGDLSLDPDAGPVPGTLPGAGALVAVPVQLGDTRLGVIGALSATPGAFGADDLHILTVVADRTALGIDNARLRATITRQAQEVKGLERLREADRSRTEFISMLAHELNGPMGTIAGFGSMLREHWDTLPEAKRTRFLDILSSETDRLSRLVQDLLDVSRMETGTVRYDVQPTSLVDLVEGFLEVHPSLRAEHVVETNMPDDLPKVLADKDRIRQVLLNLLTNAAAYSPRDTRIRLHAVAASDAGEAVVQVSVADEGIGIGEDDLERVFSKFVMLPKPAWAKKGTGLGLFITKGIVDAHGGRIWVESEPGKGSTFHFTLRVAR